jgi:2-keto-4-pentenoate hydratase
MTDTDLAARTLIAARETGKPIDALAAAARPQSPADAYTIQDLSMHALGAIGGWKVGARSPDAEPACSPLPASLVLPSPQSFVPMRFPLHLVEAEIAFTLGRDLPPRAQPYTIDDLAAAVASVHAAIEILASRYIDFRAQDPLSQLADFQNNGALVVGPGRTTDTRVDQKTAAVELDVGGAPVLQVTGGNTAGDVFRLLAWLANHAAARCGGLRKGQVVTTGSCIGMYEVPPQSRVRATFTGLEPVEVAL